MSIIPLRCSSLLSPAQRTLMLTLLYLCYTTIGTSMVAAQEPVPTPPQVYIDTTWNPPNGATWNVNTAAGFQQALNMANPGDTIVLAAATQFVGNFKLPAKSNPNGLWIYIESANLSNLPPPGSRIDPSNTPDMPQVVSPNAAPTLAPAPGSNYYRLIGLEITTASTQGCKPNNVPPTNCFTYFLFGQSDGGQGHPTQLPDHIFIDRCYMHGSPTQDVNKGVQGNVTYLAVIDSYISDIHESTTDSQAIGVYFTPGPIKIVDNYLSATTEDVMFGGGGGTNNPYVPSDIEIRKNHLYKPLSWDAPGITLPPHAMWTEKNNLEFKSLQRAVVTGNLLENTWVDGQAGASVLFTVRTSQSGNVAVVDDIDFESNIMNNVDSGFETLEQDFQCSAQYGYPNCSNPGESRRIKVYNNLLLLSTNPDTYQHLMVRIDGGNATHPGLKDYVFQHNTVLMSDQSQCWNSIYFNANQGEHWPPPQSYTTNLWFLDNAFCRQPSGDYNGQGTAGLTNYMGNPAPLAPRYFGNVMFVPRTDRVQSWPSNSDDATTTPFTYVDPSSGNYQLLIPDWLNTSDGKISGIDYNQLQQAFN